MDEKAWNQFRPDYSVADLKGEMPPREYPQSEFILKGGIENADRASITDLHQLNEKKSFKTLLK